MSLNAQLDFLERVRPLVRSRRPYTVLSEIVRSGNGLGSAEQQRSRQADKNVGRVFDLLEGERLIRWRKGRYVATRAGRQLVRQLEKATDAPPVSVIEGRRLVSVTADADGGLDSAERLLADADADVLYADGKYEIVAVLPDDHALVSDLRLRLRSHGHGVATTRIVGGQQ
jgi:hypothetical protein